MQGSIDVLIKKENSGPIKKRNGIGTSDEGRQCNN